MAPKRRTPEGIEIEPGERHEPRFAAQVGDAQISDSRPSAGVLPRALSITSATTSRTLGPDPSSPKGSGRKVMTNLVMGEDESWMPKCAFATDKVKRVARCRFIGFDADEASRSQASLVKLVRQHCHPGTFDREFAQDRKRWDDDARPCAARKFRVERVENIAAESQRLVKGKASPLGAGRTAQIELGRGL